jgi:hypothetical protein
VSECPITDGGCGLVANREHLDAISITLTRIDERTEQLLDRQERTDKSIHEIRDGLHSVSLKVVALESSRDAHIGERVQILADQVILLERRLALAEAVQGAQEGRWKALLGQAAAVLQSLAVAYVLYKIGLAP